MLQRYFEVIIFKNYSRHLSSVSFGTLETIFIQIFLGLGFFLHLSKQLEIAILLSVVKKNLLTSVGIKAPTSG